MSTMTALIIEDNPEQAQRIARRLTREGYDCTIASNGLSGCQKLSSGKFSLAVVDIMLPKISGLEVIRRAREAGITTPIVILSAKDECADRISGLNLGADYYLTKPFVGDELVAAVRSVLRRSEPSASTRKLVFEDIELDPERVRVVRGGKVINLPPHEFKLLCYLMKNPGLVISPDTIVLRVWRYNCLPSTNIVVPRIYSLRKRLMEFGGRDVIHTERNIGYVLR